jgi:membrane protein
MHRVWTRASRFLTHDVWHIDLGGVPTFRALFFRTARILFLAGRGFFKDQCLFRASALTFVTVLSMVPLLALGFSIAKGFGAYKNLRMNTIEPFLDKTFGPIPWEGEGPAPPPGSGNESGGTAAPVAAANAEGPAAVLPPSDPPGLAGSELRRATGKILDFVDKTDVTSLGLLGLGFLLVTVIQLLGNIEQSFNDIWKIRRSRSLIRKVSDYLAMVVVVPIFVLVGSGVTTLLQLADVFLRLTALIAVCLGFTFVNLFMPNTRVRITSALLGGIVAGCLWQIIQVGHVRFQLGMARYNAIYSGFAAFPIFLIWLWFSWVVVLLGAELAYAHQNEVAYGRVIRDLPTSHRYRESLALRAIGRIVEAFLKSAPPWTTLRLSGTLKVPEGTLERALDPLVDAGFLAEGGTGPDVTWLLARDPETLTVKMVLDAEKGPRVPSAEPQGGEPADERAGAVLEGLAADQEHSRWNLTLAALVRGEESSGPRPRTPKISATTQSKD